MLKTKRKMSLKADVKMYEDETPKMPVCEYVRPKDDLSKKRKRF